MPWETPVGKKVPAAAPDKSRAGWDSWIRPSVVTLAAALALGSSASSALAYDFHKSITIDRSKISDASCGATLTNFPMLFSVTDADLAHTGSGGNVTDLGGDDIIFTGRDATTCGGPALCVLDHEIERYVSATGELVAWVRIPSVNTAAAGSDTVIYIDYGDSTVSSPTENPNGVWDASFKGVWHLEEDVVDEATGATHDDSTANANDGTQNGNVERAGQIADGQDFDGVNDRIDIPNTGVVNPVTVSAWVEHDTLPAAVQRYVNLNDIVSIRHDGANSVGQLDFFIRSGGTAYHLRANGALTTGTRYHVVGTWDGAVQRLFLNGSQLLSQPRAVALDPIGGINTISQTAEPMDGILDEVRISTTARPACWIDAEYDNQDNPGDIGAPGFYTVGAEVTPYAYLKPITIDRSKIPGTCGATLANYPMLFSVTDADLAHTASGGDVTDPGGDDIIFKAHDAATCGGAAPCTLDHEIERYVSATGELVAWVRIPSVNTASAGSDTEIYVYYGNSTVTSPTENPAGVWGSVYAGVWHLEESVTDDTSGGIHDDSTSNGNDGTQANNGPITGVIAGAQDFDGAGDFITVADDDTLSFNPDNAFSVSAWVFADTASSNVIVAKDASAVGEWDLYVRSTGTLSLIVNDGNLSNKIGRYTNGAYPTGAWHHVTATYDGGGTSAGIRLYIDGVAQATSDYSAGTYVAMDNTTEPVLIGAWDGGGNSYDMDGRIDEVRIANSELSSCWVRASYENHNDPGDIGSPGFYTVGAATAVELVSFEARGLDSVVELSWETGSELDNLGFHVYRSSSSSGPWERITSTLIPGLGSSVAGARYRYRDTGLTNGETYYYELEDIETTGRRERHGPVAVSPAVGVVSGGDEAPVEEERPGSVITYGEPGGNRFRELRRGRRHVVLELTTSGFVAYPEADGTVRFAIEDYLGEDEHGLPTKRIWVEALAGRGVELVSVRAMDVERVGLRPSGLSEHEVVASLDGVVELRERQRGGRGVERRGAGWEAARVVSVAFQGDVKKALLELSPLNWDASRQELRLAKKLRVILSFAKREPSEQVDRDGRRGKRTWLKRQRRNGRGVIARLATRAPGLYAVGYEELFGRRGRGVDASRLRLSRLGESVAFHVEPSGSRFRPGSTLYFVSPGAEANPYGREAVYELAYGVSDGVRMPVVQATPSGIAASAYLRRDVYEENLLYQATARETWMWDLLFAPSRKGYPFTVDALAEGAEASRLELWLQGGTDFAAAPDHHVAVYVNGTLIAERSWNGKLAQALDVELGAGVLREGENLLEVDNVGDTGAPYSMVYLDRFAVSYPRHARAQNGFLEGVWRSSGTAEISEVSSAPAMVDTTSTPPLWLRDGALSSEGVVRFRADAEHRYLVVEAHRMERAELRRASRRRWTGGSSPQGDYVVVGPRAFLEAAAPLLEHRRRQGLTALAVPVEELYAEFGYGESRPEAVREFLAHAYHRWTSVPPRYVVLLGDATYDFKDYQQTGVVNHVPPMMLKTSFLWTASDPTYAAVNGDDLLPDLAIGRLPAASVEEVRVMVDKILAYERGEASLAAPVVLVSDDADEGGDFHADAEALAATVLAGRSPRHISLQELGTEASRQAVLDAFDGGASVLSYIGHGGIDLWASEKLLDASSVASLSAQSQQPLVLTMNCLNGYFHFPYFDSLSEALVKAEGKGAIAAFSPSGMSLNGPAQIYHRALLDAVLNGQHPRLGDAVLAAQRDYAETGAFPELLSIYHLFGDPALILR